MNFDNRSPALNEEDNLVVYDPDFGARVDSLFLDDLARSREVRLPVFSPAPLVPAAEGARRRPGAAAAVNPSYPLPVAGGPHPLTLSPSHSSRLAFTSRYRFTTAGAACSGRASATSTPARCMATSAAPRA